MTILVTGGGGFIGSRVVRLLCARGLRVRCLLRPGGDARRLDGLPVERIAGDVRERAAVRAALEGCAGCIHLAAVVAWARMDDPELERVSVEGTRNLLESARELAGIGRIVHVSSAVAVNASSEPRVFDEQAAFELEGSGLRYALAKHRAEKLALQAAAEGLPVVVVNPGEVYGPDDHAFVTAGSIRDVLRSVPCIVVRGGTSITHVDDVADGILRAYETGRPGERYILAGDNVSVEQLARLALRLAGRRTPVVRLPNGLVRGTLRALRALRLPAPIEPGVIDYAMLFTYMDSTKAREQLGYRWRSAEEVLAPVVAWLQAGGHV